MNQRSIVRGANTNRDCLNSAEAELVDGVSGDAVALTLVLYEVLAAE